MKDKWVFPVVCLTVGVLLICVIGLCLGLGFYTYKLVEQSSTGEVYSEWNGTPSDTPLVIRPTLSAPGNQPGGTPPSGTTPLSTLTVSSSQAEAVEKTLQEVVVPENNLIDLAGRLQGKKNIAATQEAPSKFYSVGDQQSFWVSNVDTNENFNVDATLRYETDHAYFWVENDVEYNPKDLKDLGDTFEDKIYPTDREFFGSEWTPGVDNDPHIYVIYVKNAGGSIAGYFSSVDEYPPTVHQYSNWHETFMFNADNVDLREEFTYGVLAHEFQHMIHWYRDRNEDSWLNEGFSDLAMFLNGYDTGGHDSLFTYDPDLQLNDWPTDHNATPPHYGASFLFTNYFLDRFGEDATKALVARPENGLVSIDALLKEMDLKDSLTDQVITADDVFIDWVLANYIHNGKVGDGRYNYHRYKNAPRTSDTETFSTCGDEVNTRDVHQYGVDYIQISCEGSHTLHFEGSTLARILPADAHSGSWSYWSNKGDESDMTLTRNFDFSNASGALTLEYWTWYDLEKDYDYVYVEASTDGQSWTMLEPPSGSRGNISGNNFGIGYNAMSGGGEEAQWVEESVDLSAYAGKKVQIRFEYVTDAAVNGEGFLLDDVSVPEINYSTDFEKDDGGWSGDGFVRIQNNLPQTYRLALITHGKTTTVQYLELSSDNVLDLPFKIGGDIKDVVLVVTGTTRFTRLPSAYRFSFIK